MTVVYRLLLAGWSVSLEKDVGAPSPKHSLGALANNAESGGIINYGPIFDVMRGPTRKRNLWQLPTDCLVTNGLTSAR